MAVVTRPAPSWGVRGWGLPAALVLAVIALWELLVRLSETPRWFLPPPSAVLLALAENWRALAGHAGVTLQAVLLGFAVAFVVGVGLAIAIVASRVVERAVYPLVVGSQAVPIIALAPILLIWFGYGLTPKVIVVALICFFPIAVNTVDGLRGVDADLLNLMRSLGAGRWATLRAVRLPAALPYLLSGARIAAAVSVIGALIGEWVGSSAGLGYYMIRSAAQFHTDRVFAAVLVSAVLGVLMFAAVASVERLLVPWRRFETERGA